MTHEQAMDAAELFDLTVNNSGGRLERPEMFGKLGVVVLVKVLMPFGVLSEQDVQNRS